MLQMLSKPVEKIKVNFTLVDSDTKTYNISFNCDFLGIGEIQLQVGKGGMSVLIHIKGVIDEDGGISYTITGDSGTEIEEVVSGNLDITFTTTHDNLYLLRIVGTPLFNTTIEPNKYAEQVE